ADLSHFVIIGGHPDRSGMFKFTACRHLLSESFPKFLRIARQCELSLAVVHHDYVAHSRCCGSCREVVYIENDDTQSFFGEGRSTCGTYDSRSNNGHIKVRHPTMPKR